VRAVIFSTVLPGVHTLFEAARTVGITPVAVITPRLVRDAEGEARRNEILAAGPEGVDLCFVADTEALERLTRAYEPDIGLCAGFPWLIPPEVLAIPRVGVVNTHASLLPRHRGPYPFAWAVREADDTLGMTVHLMDDYFDTGPILAQGSRPMPEDTTFEGMIPTLRELAGELTPRALRRLLSGDRGDPQTDDGATYAGPFGEDYAELDPVRPRAELHRQVRAWQLMWNPSVVGPVATVAGGRVRVLEAALDDPGDRDALRLDAADGPLWLTAFERL
jgi:methionyl-tRNA formyltransferase